METAIMGDMKNSSYLKLYNLFRKDLHLSDESASELVSTLDESMTCSRKDAFSKLASKDDLNLLKTDIHDLELKMERTQNDLRRELTKTIYSVGLIQFLAVMGSVIGIILLFLKK